MTLYEYIICLNCGSKDYPLSELKGYEGLCIPCECEKMNDEFDKQAENELNIYKNRTGQKYDFNNFYWACQDELILIDNLKKLPMLKEIYTDVKNEQKRQDETQLQLDFFQNDLPF